MSVSQDLYKAADIMDKRGKCTGDAIDYQGRVCALGAIGLATVPNFERKQYNYMYAIHTNDRANAAEAALASHLGGGVDNVWRTNDRLRGWGAKKKMVKIIRAAAAAAEEAERQQAELKIDPPILDQIVAKKQLISL